MENNDTFKFIYQTDGVFIVINPSKAIDKNSLLSQIIDRVNVKKVRNVDRKALQNAIDNAKGELIKIAEPQEELRTNANIVVNIAPDKMSATMTMIPPDGGSNLTATDILNLLQAKNVNTGIDMAVVYKMAAEPVYGTPIKIAEGTLTTKGEDGRLELLFDATSDRKPRILEDGSVDFREINFVKTVEQGQELAKIIQPQNGVDGKNVMGQNLIAPKGKPIPNAVGKNVEVLNNIIYASISGYASFVDNKVSVMTVLDIPGNVDVSTGNIRFNGNVIIRGNVLTDYVVEATGYVEVHGVVEGATIKADGDIVLKRGIQGLQKGLLSSGNDIVARYIEHCSIAAKNDIKCEAIMHCNVKCGGVLELSGKKGLIVGGTIKVGKEIHAKFIGSPMSTVTDIEVGIDPGKRDRYKELMEKQTNFEKELDKSTKSVEVLRKSQATGFLPMDKKIMLGKLEQLKIALTAELKNMEEEVNTLEEELTAAHKGRIKVKNTIYSGVKITIGSISKYIKENTDFVVFRLEGADIRSNPYE